jgi:hypothetical protein
MSSSNSITTSPFLEAANKAAKFKVYLWARDVFRETFVIFLRQIVVEQHIKERQISDSDDPLKGRTIVVTEQNIHDANATVERLGYQWIHCLQESHQVDAEEAVRDALLRGNFFVSDSKEVDTTSSSVMSSSSSSGHADGEETNESLAVDVNQNSNETGDDICGLYEMAKKRLQDVATSSHTNNPTTGVPYWHPLPGRTSTNGLHLPQTTILPESVTNQPSCYKTVTGIFGIPKPYLKTWDEDQWCRSLIRKLDQRHQGNSQLPYSWSMVQQLTKAIPERLHFTARNKNRNRKGAKYDTIEIVPKSTISRQGNENPSCNSLVESHTNSNINHNENTDSNITTANNRTVLQRNTHTEEEEYKEDEPILLGSTKFQERFAIKKRRRERIREEEQALQQETNNNGRNNINETDGTINNHNHREDEARQPSALPELILLHWSDLDDDDDANGDKLVPNPADETVCHTLQGALKNVGLFHEKIQSIIDLDEDLHDDDDSNRNMLAACNGKDRKRLRKERLGKLDNAASVGGNISDHISCGKKRGQSASSRVLRVVRKGEEWMEIDLGECLLQFDMATLEGDANTSSSNSNRSDMSSTSTEGGRQRNPSYKLYAFRSLEISASLGD